MHTWLLFIYRFPGEYTYQNECSLGNSANGTQYHLRTAAWNQSCGSEERAVKHQNPALKELEMTFSYESTELRPFRN